MFFKKKKYVYLANFIAEKGGFHKQGVCEVTLDGKVKSMADVKTMGLHIANKIGIDGMPLVIGYQLLRKERADK